MIFAIAVVVVAVAVVAGIAIHQSKKEKPGFLTYTGDRVIITTLKKEGNLTLENLLIDNTETLLCSWPINEEEDVKKCKLNGAVVKNVEVVDNKDVEKTFYTYEAYLRWNKDNSEIDVEVYGQNEEGQNEVILKDIAKDPFPGASL